MRMFDFNKINEIFKTKWNTLILIVFIKAVILLFYLFVDFQALLQSTYSFADHLYYTEFGVAISNGYFPSNQKTLGLPLLLAPFFSIFKPNYAGPLFEPIRFIVYLIFLNSTSNFAISYIIAYLIPLIPISQSILLPWAIFNGIILGSLAPLALNKIINNILNNEKLAFIGALTFIIYPFIFLFSYSKLIYMSGFLLLSDYTSVLFIVFSIYLFIKIEKNEEQGKNISIYEYFLFGIITGFTVLLRITNILILICFIIFILFSKTFINQFNGFRKEKNVIVSFLKSFYEIIKEKKRYLFFILVFGIVISFQLIYNKIHFGGYLTFGYSWYYDHFYRYQILIPEFRNLGFVGIDYALLTPNGNYSISYLRNSIPAIMNGYFWEIIISLAGILILLIKKEKSLPFLLSLCLVFIIIYSLYGFAQVPIEAVRFLLPLIPVFCIFIGIVIYVLIYKDFNWIKERSE